MPPKAPKPRPGKGKSSDENKEDPLQAVVLADTFENKFAPFNLERPRCLLPLANTPLIEYTLEFLASVGVQEVYLYAGAHVDQVETYINASRWRLLSSPFKKFAFLRCVATSVGDVMRDLDQKHILAGDFIVVSGDVVCDFPIGRALKKHKARREKDKNAIMTMLLRETESNPRQSSHTSPTFVIDPIKDRCLHYEESASTAAFGLHVDPEILKTPELDIRQDLIDCRIDICTPDVLSLWSDNFDNQAPRRDFLFGVLKDYELNGKTVHTYVMQDHYAARIADLPTYAKISEDLITGAIQSMKIENNVFPEMHYKQTRQGPSVNQGVINSRPLIIDSSTVVGSNTSIGAESHIERSIVGEGCHVGKGTRIESSYIWDYATIGHNVRVTKAIVGGETFIGDDCTIGEGALISFGVKIASGTNVPPGVKVTKVQKPGQSTRSEKSLVVADGNGYEYSDDEDDDPAGPTPGLLYEESMFADSASTLASDISEPSSPINGSRSQSFATSISDDDGTDRFQHDTVAILLQRMLEGKMVDDMLSELMGLRFSGGADETQVRKAVAGAMARRICGQIEEGVSAADASRRTLTAYKTLIRRAQAVQTTSEQAEFLLDVQKELTRRKEGSKVLLFMTKDLYDLDVFGEEAFLSWWNDSESSADPEMVEVRKQAEQFIQWLESAESESEEDEQSD
jgi:translation initiation factor eIF-2B subunit epsilon